MTGSILGAFWGAVQRHPDRIAIIDGKGHAMTFRDLSTRADALARAWHVRGIRAGDRVLLAMRVDGDLYASLAALWSLGATVVLPEPAMGLAGLRHAARVSGATAFCGSGAFRFLNLILPDLWPLRPLRMGGKGGPLPTLPDPDDTDIALISFTSGTTGEPKAIPRNHAFLTAQHHAIAPLLESGPDDRDLVAFPVFVLINLAGGRTSVLPDWKMARLRRVTPERLAAWMTAQAVTRALLPPVLCEMLAKVAMPAALHTVFTGGGPVFPHLLQKLSAAKEGLRIVCVYGSTEAEPIAHLDATDIGDHDIAAMRNGQGLLAGRPVADIGLRIVENEIQVSGQHVNNGYLDPAHDVRNKITEGSVVWHRTGDAGYLDDRGRLWLLGRVGSQVRSSDGVVYPFAVEVAVMDWPGVTRCALMPAVSGGCLVVEGDGAQMPSWRDRAQSMDIASVRHVAEMPMDKRHASKVDRVALRRLLGC